MLKAEMDRLIKSLPERKRRTFLRYMKKGKEGEKNKEETEEGRHPHKTLDIDSGSTHFFIPEASDVPLTAEEVIQARRQARRKRVPHSRADLLNKIEMLRIAEDDEDEDEEAGDSDEENTDSDEYEFDSDDLESEDEAEELP